MLRMLVGLSIKARIWSEESRFDVDSAGGSVNVLTCCEVPAINNERTSVMHERDTYTILTTSYRDTRGIQRMHRDRRARRVERRDLTDFSCG